MESLPEEVPVLIVGAGPVGTCAANLLGRYGVPTLILDKEKEIQKMPRAISLDNEALRILQMAGLEEGSFETYAIPYVNFQSAKAKTFATVNSGGNQDGHPKLVTFYQPELETVLRKRLKKYSCINSAYGIELLGIQNHDDHVCVLVKLHNGETQTIKSRYVIACDGASSPIRKKIGIGFKGKSYEEDWLIIDAIDVKKPMTHLEFICDPLRPTPHMPAPGNRERWEFKLRPNETPEEMLEDNTIRELLKPWADLDKTKIERKAVYKFHARVTETFQRDRIFLAGDAAHITPPFVGQGLCAGLRDVANLSWKLAWVINHHATPKMLDSYTVERKPHAASMIQLARLAGELIAPKKPHQGKILQLFVNTIQELPWVSSFLRELKIKPKNTCKQGMFEKKQQTAQLQSGGHFPQVLLKGKNNQYSLSDDVLGDAFVLVGFGIDPEEELSANLLYAWKANGGRCVKICHRGQSLDTPYNNDCWEDITGNMLPEAAPLGSMIVVRPDRVVMNIGTQKEANKLVKTTLKKLGKSPFLRLNKAQHIA